MSEPIYETLLLDGAFEPHRVTAFVAGGAAIAYTNCDPGKETGNEDSVALLPYGPAAAVLVVADGAGGLPAGKRARRCATIRAKIICRSLERSTMNSLPN